MIQLIYMLTFITSLSFMQINHPLAMGLTLLIRTVFICMMTGLITKTFWFSYILFLIFLGGMLMLFIYVTSLASNEMFSFSTKMIMYLTIMFTVSLMIVYMINDNLYINMNMFNNEMNEITQQIYLVKENSLSLNKLYNYPTNMFTILLMNYLLITSIAIVKITKLFYEQMNKPIRTIHPIFKIMNNSLVDLPAPSNISSWWNFGSLLGLCLIIQILTGFI